MKKVISIVIFISILLSGCIPATSVPALTDIPFVSKTPTHKPVQTSTLPPASTPIPSTATFSPIEAILNTSGPFTLTESNVGTEMKLLNIIGTGTAYDIEFSPDGRLLAVATGRGVFLYDGISFKQNGFLEMNIPVSAIAFSPDGEALALAMNGRVSLLNINSGQKIKDLDGELVSVSKLVYGVGGYVAAIGGTCRGCGSPQVGVILWDAKTGRPLFSQKNIGFFTIGLEFTSDGKHLMFGDAGISVVETRTGKSIASFNSGETRISAALDVPYNFIFNNDGTGLYISSYEYSSEFFSLSEQTRKRFPLCDIYLTGNGKIGACPEEQKMLIFDLQNGNELQSIDMDIDASSLGNMFTISPDSKFLVYYGKTGINIINLTTNEKIYEIELTDFGIAETGIIEIDGDEKYVVATLTSAGQVEVFDIQTGELIRKLKSDCCEIKGFSFAPDRKTLATVEENLLELWDLQTGDNIYMIELERDYSGPIAFSSDGFSVFLTDLIEDYIIELDLQSGVITKQGENSYPYNYGSPYAVNNYNFNSSGNLMLLSYERSDQQYHPSFEDVITKGKIILPVDVIADPDFIETFSFSPDGQYLAYGNLSGIFVWNIKTLKIQSKMDGHDLRGADGWQGKVASLIFNHQSNLLVSVGQDETIRLWNPRFGTELRRLNVCCSVDFTPDGRYLVTYGKGVAYVWGIP
ncbi:MAG: WD40 repeat domain-containing protein [Anaerolineales bacterium]|nr:WD40 repeat domain-containing protein [Anaerolineales bacterium]WKZ40803.1 MAG: WD40 repeat domain-containing protein [Anaerolineales bacterium]